jgi:hypothetical protein
MVLRVRTPDATIQAERLTNAYDAIEEVLKSLDVGGEQSRQFAEEIKILRDVTGHRQSVEDTSDEIQRRGRIVQTLRRLAFEAAGLKANLPALPAIQWLDGTVTDVAKDMAFENYDLARLLQFIADVGVSVED